MNSLAGLSLALLAGQAVAKTCLNVTVPVDIMARQGVFDIKPFEGNTDVAAFAQNFISIHWNYTDVALTGYQTVTGSYDISAKYCKPDNDDSSNPTVQFLIHGIGFDKTYWDLSFNDYNYSYVDAAVERGFHTVVIDRFGIGNSSHADPLNIVQAPAEVSAIYEITSMLRNGNFPDVPTKFEKVVHVGHSFGSAQTYLLSALHPEASDGIVLTGWSMNATWLPVTIADWNLHIARLNSPLRFGNVSRSAIANARSLLESYGSDLVSIVELALASVGIDLSQQDVWQELATTELGSLINGINDTVAPIPQDLPTGYLTWPDLTANQFAFALAPYFDPAIALVAEKTKQPVTLGELFTLANGAPPTTPFTGPALIVTGREDVIYCGGDCLATGGTGPSIPAAAQPAFPDVSDFEAYIHPNTGHGINVHYNSTGAYSVINDWFVSHGLGSS